MTVPALIDVFPALSKAIASLAAGTATPGAGFAQLFATLLGTEKDGETLVEPDAKQPNTTGAEALAGAAAAAVAAAPPITPAPETGPAAGGKAAGAPTGAPTSPSTAPVASAAGVEVGSAGVEVGSEGAVETAAPVPGAPP